MKVPIIVEERGGIARISEPVTVGIPCPKGALIDGTAIGLRDEESGLLPLQSQVLDRWSDGSSRWVLLDFQATVPALETKQYWLEFKDKGCSHFGGTIVVAESARAVQVVTGRAAFSLSKNGPFPLEEIVIDGNQILATDSPGMVLTDARHRTCKAKITELSLETNGPLRATIYISGIFRHPVKRQPFATFFSRLHFFSGHSSVKMDFTVRNPRAAKHRGGLWDLGDPGSIFFEDLSLHLKLAEADRGEVLWSEEPRAAMRKAQDALEIYQDSSGGENWQSRNHVNHFGKVMNSFRGFRVRTGDVNFQGDRAQPTVILSSQKRCVAASIQSFWQNFPKALEASENQLVVRLFPGQRADPFELQGGEQKTHTVYLDFADHPEVPNPLAWINEPLVPRVEPEWYAKSEAFPYMVTAADDPNREYVDLVHCAIEGDNSFFHRREIIDEYGWRHFGDLYADHEAAYYSGPRPIISHYNNQYDAIYGFALHYARSGDSRWFHLIRDLSQHVIDIDIYHTKEDKTAYSGGLFWHTDHYTDAATCTHRTFSRQTKEDRRLKDYGGGPSNEHLYTTGLMSYHFMTGDIQARDAVLGLADWVVRMDDGTLTPLRFLSRGSTGLASQTTSRDYHGPGRGAGNSIDALLDAYRLSGKQDYLTKAEELVRRCIHPADSIDAIDFSDVERHWSYLVFLQVLGKYLDCKVEWNQFDYMFHYAQRCLLHYARWIVDYEVPNSQVLDKVEYPTETWIVHDLRKSNILEWAAVYSNGTERQRFLEKANFFYENCLHELKHYTTATRTRPLVLLLRYGYMHGYFRSHGVDALADWQQDSVELPHAEPFRSQRCIVEQRLKILGRIGGALITSLLGLAFLYAR